MSFKPGVPRPNHRQSDLDFFIGFTDHFLEDTSLMIKLFFILNKVTPQKNRCVGCWLPRAQMTRLSRILGVWFTYYVPVLINFMTPSKHLSIAYQGINLRRLLRFFFLSKAPHVLDHSRKDRTSVSDSSKPTFASIGKLTVMSFANLTRRFLLVSTALISLIKGEKRIGPRTVPWGTPLFIETYLVRSHRQRLSAFSGLKS